MSCAVKICGLSSAAAIEAAIRGKVAYIGFVFFPKSPRAVTPAQAARLAQAIPPGIAKVGLFVDADPAVIDAVLGVMSLDLLQFHGSESPEQCRALSQHFRHPVMKAIAVAGPEDLDHARRYEGAVDRLLFDAKSAAAGLPGGNGIAFDWRLLADRQWSLPWMLSGGLNAGNLREAVRATRAHSVDVSSGVETSPGIKDPAKIQAFLDVAQTL